MLRFFIYLKVYLISRTVFRKPLSWREANTPRPTMSQYRITFRFIIFPLSQLESSRPYAAK
jgi:hypothetical protein